jgi:hypothetical protein
MYPEVHISQLTPQNMRQLADANLTIYARSIANPDILIFRPLVPADAGTQIADNAAEHPDEDTSSAASASASAVR